MKTNVFNLSFTSVVMRFYLMMAVVILAGFTGIWALGLLSLPIFLSAILGFSVGTEKKTKEAKMVTLKERTKRNKAM